MKVKITKVERDREVAMNRIHITMVAVFTAQQAEEMRPAENALVYLGQADCPIDVHLNELELVRAMSTEDLERMLNEIMFELDDRA